MAGMVDGLDVASAGELRLARAAKPARAISFAGPGKRDDELAVAIGAGATLNVESAGEGARALAIGDRLGIAPRLAVRVNPDIELRGSGMKMGGRPSPFGVDADRAAALVRTLIDGGADWRGFHLYAGSQALDADGDRRDAGGDAGARGAAGRRGRGRAAARQPGRRVRGSLFRGDRSLDVEAIGTRLAAALASRDAILADSRFAIELGRWLVAEAGVYLTRIVDRKVSQGETFLVVDGGLNHQLAASGNFGTVVRRNYPLALASAMGADASETVSVVGPLCTPLDRLGDRIALPPASGR